MTPRRRVRLALGWYDHHCHRGVARFAQQHQWHLWSAQAMHTAIHEQWTGDGFITNGMWPNEMNILYQRVDLPVVGIDLRIGRERAGQVVTDHEAIGRLAFDHFRQRGFEHFAWFSRYESPELARALAFERAAGEAGLYCEPIAWFREIQEQPGPSRTRRRWLARMVAKLPRPVAILAVNDSEAVDLLDACEEKGLAVPDRVAVMGVGNTPEICDYAPVPLTSIDVSREACGWEAAALLQRMMDGEEAPAEPIIVPLKGVVPRLSTDVIAVRHPEVARAVRFIWDHATQPIGVQEVVDAVGLSRRALFEAFKKHLHRSPHQEILRRRLEIARRLLLETDLKVKQIYAQAGFASLNHLYQAFAREYGTPPRQFRMQHRATGPMPDDDDSEVDMVDAPHEA